MEDTLKRLLAAEGRANEISQAAKISADKLIDDALRDAREREEHFQARLPELRAAFMDKAEKRAEQSIKELQRRYDERLAQLRALAETHENASLEAAFAQLLDTDGR